MVVNKYIDYYFDNYPLSEIKEHFTILLCLQIYVQNFVKDKNGKEIFEQIYCMNMFENEFK